MVQLLVTLGFICLFVFWYVLCCIDWLIDRLLVDWLVDQLIDWLIPRVNFTVTDSFYFSEPVKRFVRMNQWFYYLSYAVFIVTYITLVCCPGVRRRYPTNLILLAIFVSNVQYSLFDLLCFSKRRTEYVFVSTFSRCFLLCFLDPRHVLHDRHDFQLLWHENRADGHWNLLGGLFCGVHHGSLLQGAQYQRFPQLIDQSINQSLRQPWLN